jgi:acyl-coenzyme A synthetase/AMP-(fatty) acid ligase
MSRAPFKFDLSVFDIFNTFKAGATLVCFDWLRQRERSAKHLDYVSLMERTRATVLYTTPSTLVTLMNRGELTAERSSLRLVMYAGEPFPTPLLRKFQERLPRVRIANIYGPTETNIITYFWIESIPAEDSPVPLGAEVEDTEILIVSEDRKRICMPDEVGEIWCRGGTVTLGYLNMPEKTADCLVESPFHHYPAKFWRTGDYGRRDAHGVLHYHGRRDHMVKVKGFRVELGEIETALSKHLALDEFVVVAVPDGEIGNRLVAYYSVLAGKNVSELELHDFIASLVPAPMVPFRFVCRSELPQTSSGKVDRVKLAEEAGQLFRPNR